MGDDRSNPHPVRRLGAILCFWDATAFKGVPILTQSEDWALSGNKDTGASGGRSSNPHPVRRLGAIVGQCIRLSRFCSNPHPVRRLGAILTASAMSSTSFGSNPHPVRRLGAIADFEFDLVVRFEFQSSPSPKTGRYSTPLGGL